jgi:hypothetical protein
MLRYYCSSVYLKLLVPNDQERTAWHVARFTRRSNVSCRFLTTSIQELTRSSGRNAKYYRPDV